MKTLSKNFIGILFTLCLGLTFSMSLVSDVSAASKQIPEKSPGYWEDYLYGTLPGCHCGHNIAITKKDDTNYLVKFSLRSDYQESKEHSISVNLNQKTNGSLVNKIGWGRSATDYPINYIQDQNILMVYSGWGEDVTGFKIDFNTGVLSVLYCKNFTTPYGDSDFYEYGVFANMKKLDPIVLTSQCTSATPTCSSVNNGDLCRDGGACVFKVSETSTEMLLMEEFDRNKCYVSGGYNCTGIYDAKNTCDAGVSQGANWYLPSRVDGESMINILLNSSADNHFSKHNFAVEEEVKGGGMTSAPYSHALYSANNDTLLYIGGYNNTVYKAEISALSWPDTTKNNLGLGVRCVKRVPKGCPAEQALVGGVCKPLYWHLVGWGKDSYKAKVALSSMDSIGLAPTYLGAGAYPLAKNGNVVTDIQGYDNYAPSSGKFNTAKVVDLATIFNMPVTSPWDGYWVQSTASTTAELNVFNNYSGVPKKSQLRVGWNLVNAYTLPVDSGKKFNESLLTFYNETAYNKAQEKWWVQTANAATVVDSSAFVEKIFIYEGTNKTWKSWNSDGSGNGAINTFQPESFMGYGAWVFVTSSTCSSAGAVPTASNPNPCGSVKIIRPLGCTADQIEDPRKPGVCIARPCAISDIVNSATVSGDVPNCIAKTCVNGYKLDPVDQKSCVADAGPGGGNPTGGGPSTAAKAPPIDQPNACPVLTAPTCSTETLTYSDSIIGYKPTSSTPGSCTNYTHPYSYDCNISKTTLGACPEPDPVPATTPTPATGFYNNSDILKFLVPQTYAAGLCPTTTTTWTTNGCSTTCTAQRTGNGKANYSFTTLTPKISISGVKNISDTRAYQRDEILTLTISASTNHSIASWSLTGKGIVGGNQSGTGSPSGSFSVKPGYTAATYTLTVTENKYIQTWKNCIGLGGDSNGCNGTSSSNGKKEETGLSKSISIYLVADSSLPSITPSSEVKWDNKSKTFSFDFSDNETCIDASQTKIKSVYLNGNKSKNLADDPTWMNEHFQAKDCQAGAGIYNTGARIKDNGEHEVTLQVTNKAGKTKILPPITLRVDTEAPKLSITNKSGSNTINADQPRLIEFKLDDADAFPGVTSSNYVSGTQSSSITLTVDKCNDAWNDGAIDTCKTGWSTAGDATSNFRPNFGTVPNPTPTTSPQKNHIEDIMINFKHAQYRGGKKGLYRITLDATDDAGNPSDAVYQYLQVKPGNISTVVGENNSSVSTPGFFTDKSWSADGSTTGNVTVTVRDKWGNPLGDRKNVRIVGNSGVYLDQLSRALGADDAISFGANKGSNISQEVYLGDLDSAGNAIIQLAAWAPTLSDAPPYGPASRNLKLYIRAKSHSFDTYPNESGGADIQPKVLDTNIEVAPALTASWTKKTDFTKNTYLPFTLQVTKSNTVTNYANGTASTGGAAKVGVFVKTGEAGQFDIQTFALAGDTTTYRTDVVTPSSAVSTTDISRMSSKTADSDDEVFWLGDATDNTNATSDYSFNIRFSKKPGVTTVDQAVNMYPFAQYTMNVLGVKKDVRYPLQGINSADSVVTNRLYNEISSIEGSGLTQTTNSTKGQENDVTTRAAGSTSVPVHMASVKKQVKTMALSLDDNGGKGIVKMVSGKINGFVNVYNINNSRTYITKGEDLVITEDIFIGNEPLAFVSLGGNLVIKGNITYTATSIRPTIALIALYDESEPDVSKRGGEIHIANESAGGVAIKEIVGTMVAEKGILAINSVGSTSIVDASGLSNRSTVLTNQVRITGQMISLNTIGGGTVDAAGNFKCPSIIRKTNCNEEVAQQYDINFIRRYVPSMADTFAVDNSGTVGVDTTAKGPVIIEYYANKELLPVELTN